MRGLVVAPKPVALEALRTATADLHVPIAEKDGLVELAEVDPTVVVVVAAEVR